MPSAEAISHVPTKGWNTPEVLDAAITLMIADHGYPDVIYMLARKLREEGQEAEADGVNNHAAVCKYTAAQLDAAADNFISCTGEIL